MIAVLVIFYGFMAAAYVGMGRVLIASNKRISRLEAKVDSLESKIRGLSLSNKVMLNMFSSKD